MSIDEIISELEDISAEINAIGYEMTNVVFEKGIELSYDLDGLISQLKDIEVAE